MGLNFVTASSVCLLVSLLHNGVSAELDTKDIIGLAVGGSIGGVVFIVLVIVCIILLCRPSKKKSADKKPVLVRKDSPRSGSGNDRKKKQPQESVPPGIWTSNPTMWATGPPNGISTLPPPGYQYHKPYANGHGPAPMLAMNGEVANGKQYDVNGQQYGHRPAHHHGRQPWFQRTLRALKRLPAVFQVRRAGEYQEFRDGTFSSGATSTLPPGGHHRGKHGYEGQRAIQAGGHSTYDMTRQVRMSKEQQADSKVADQEMIDTLIKQQGTVTARVFSEGGWSNPVVKTRPPSSPTRPRSEVFVAKAYSDYQDPKDAIGPPKTPTDETGEYVARAFSSYNSNMNRAGTDSGVASAGNSSRESGYVARAMVSGEGPTSNVAVITQSDWTLPGSKETKGSKVLRAQSAVERTRSHVVVSSRTPRTGAREPSSQQVTRGQSMVVSSSGMPGKNPYAPGILIRSNTDSKPAQGKKKKVFSISQEHRSGDGSVRPLSLGDVSSTSPVILRSKSSKSAPQQPRPSTQSQTLTNGVTEPHSKHVAHVYTSNTTGTPPEVARTSPPHVTKPALKADKKHYTAPNDPYAVYAAPVKVIRTNEVPKVSVAPASPPTPATPPVPPPFSAGFASQDDNRARKDSRGRNGVGKLNSIEEAEDHHVVGDAFKFLDEFDTASVGDNLDNPTTSRL